MYWYINILPYFFFINGLVFNANFSSISAIPWQEKIIYYINLKTYKFIKNKTYLSIIQTAQKLEGLKKE